jgi:UDP-N-acetylmuramoyl-L-alanyl-D-glutamate--2,6-diaminopimelate ligase
MMLSELLEPLPVPRDVPFSGMTLDSRSVRPGDLFCAIAGTETDGHRFIEDAVARGAVGILLESSEGLAGDASTAVVVGDLRARVGEFASRFYGHPSRSMTVAAVTGTNGKTSVSHYIAAALSDCGATAGVVGTLGAGRLSALEPFGLTTPDAISLQRYLAAMRDEGLNAVALEASSHGLAQGRLGGTAVDVAVFTNITRDHLDYHPDFDAYRDAKHALFLKPDLGAAVVNVDDPAGVTFAATNNAKQTVRVSISDSSADLYCSRCDLLKDGLLLDVVTPWGGGEIESALLGGFNVMNLLLTVGVLGVLGHAWDDIKGAAARTRNVRGRMDRVAHASEQQGPAVIVDYAHTPDALALVLQALRAHVEGELWCVFGCGGDRDVGKRPQMGLIADTHADRVVITDDNPRFESSEEIIRDILAGCRHQSDIHVIPDRAAAINYALRAAREQDMVLVAGKGHERFQDVRGERLAFDDYVVIRKVSID